MSIKSNVYILLFTDKKSFKIGKADTLLNRIKKLERDWGSPDLKNSYYIETNVSDTYNLEKGLQKLVAHYSINYDEGDGKSEFFSIEGLPVVLSYIELFTKDTNTEINKGIALKDWKTLKSQEDYEKKTKKRLTKKIEILSESIDSLNQCTNSLSKIHQIVRILSKKTDKIPFQYEIENNYINFRIKYKPSEEFESNLMRLFSFDLKYIHGWSGVNLCSIYVSGDVHQYNIRLPHLEEKDKKVLVCKGLGKGSHLEERELRPKDYYFDLLSEQILGSIQMLLPKKSYAVTENMPDLAKQMGS